MSKNQIIGLSVVGFAASVVSFIAGSIMALSGFWWNTVGLDGFAAFVCLFFSSAFSVVLGIVTSSFGDTNWEWSVYYVSGLVGITVFGFALAATCRR